jgi:hypothetical protein
MTITLFQEFFVVFRCGYLYKCQKEFTNLHKCVNSKIKQVA